MGSELIVLVTGAVHLYIYRCIKDAVQDPTIVNPGEYDLKKIQKYLFCMTEIS